MGTLLLDHIKKQACSFLQEKYKSARLALTDVTPVELLTEQATNVDPWVPDAKTMTTIAEASFETEGFWRIVDLLHGRLDHIDWKHWRQYHKSLVLLEFLLTHGPEDFADEFQCETDIIEELGRFQHIDEKGFNWGANMQKRSDRILQLLEGGDAYREARLKALRITKEIQGFGDFIPTPSSSSSSPSMSATPDSSRTSSFGTYSHSCSAYNEDNEIRKIPLQLFMKEDTKNSAGFFGPKKTLVLESISVEEKEGHIWNCPPAHEIGSLLDSDQEKPEGIISSICSKLASLSPSKKSHDDVKHGIKSFSDTGRSFLKKNLDRQFSMGY